jgi:hypothetical protein
MILLASIVLCALGIPKQSFAADICWYQRSIGEHICEIVPGAPDMCVEYISPCIGTDVYGSSSRVPFIPPNTQPVPADPSKAYADCVSKCLDPVWGVYPGICEAPAYCVDTIRPTYCQAEAYLAQCTDYISGGVEYCNAIVAFSSCENTGTGTGGICTETPVTKTYGCWGPGPVTPTPTPMSSCGNGTCNSPGESCSNWSGDCGVCPPPPTPTPTPTPPPGCPNRTCGAGESCSNCPADCGVCPPTPTPTPLPTCPNGTCNFPSESCSNCQDDCGVCPPPTTCPNGTCGAGESCSNCSADCGVCPPPTPTPTPSPPPAVCGNNVCDWSALPTICAN